RVPHPALLSFPTRRSSDLLNNLAVLYSEQFGQLDKAYELAEKAREAAPNEPHLADTLGWISFKKGDYGKAMPLLRDSASKLPDRSEEHTSELQSRGHLVCR